MYSSGIPVWTRYPDFLALSLSLALFQSCFLSFSVPSIIGFNFSCEYSRIEDALALLVLWFSSISGISRCSSSSSLASSTILCTQSAAFLRVHFSLVIFLSFFLLLFRDNGNGQRRGAGLYSFIWLYCRLLPAEWAVFDVIDSRQTANALNQRSLP